MAILLHFVTVLYYTALCYTILYDTIRYYAILCDNMRVYASLAILYSTLLTHPSPRAALEEGVLALLKGLLPRLVLKALA